MEVMHEDRFNHPTLVLKYPLCNKFFDQIRYFRDIKKWEINSKFLGDIKLCKTNYHITSFGWKKIERNYHLGYCSTFLHQDFLVLP
jgi:hypothetical protein